MEDQLLALDVNNRKNSFIIRNFPDDCCTVDNKLVKSSLDAVTVIAGVLGLDEELKDIRETFRLGKVREDGRRRLIMVKATERTCKTFLRKSRFLKQCESPLNKVFLHEDLPPAINKRLAEMRKRAYEHRTNHPNEEAFVRNNKLYLNGVVVDEITQIFLIAVLREKDTLAPFYQAFSQRI